MTSSTSNSNHNQAEPTSPLTWAVRVINAAWPTLVVTLALLGGAAAMLRRGASAQPPAVLVEDVILGAQLKRAATPTEADVLVIGDSSALMDVDAAMLGTLLGGKKVESLALIGFVGPVAQVAMAERALANGRRLPLLVWLLNGHSLDLEARWISGQPYEAQVLSGARPRLGLARELREFLYAATVGRVVARPLPGRFGEVYGFAADLENAIALGHGTVTDPNRMTVIPPRPKDGYKFALSPPVDERLPVAGERLRALPIDRVVLGITPLLQSWQGADTESSRQAVLARLCQRTGLAQDVVLATLAVLPDDHFATPTHLGARGRVEFTRSLAGALGAVTP